MPAVEEETLKTLKTNGVSLEIKSNADSIKTKEPCLSDDKELAILSVTSIEENSIDSGEKLSQENSTNGDSEIASNGHSETESSCIDEGNMGYLSEESMTLQVEDDEVDDDPEKGKGKTVLEASLSLTFSFSSVFYPSTAWNVVIDKIACKNYYCGINSLSKNVRETSFE